MDFTPLHFYDPPVEVLFDTPPVREKTPDCPNGFIWEAKIYRVTEMLSSWTDFKRRGRVALNMRQLRKKLEEDSERPQYILTESGIGYRFIADE